MLTTLLIQIGLRFEEALVSPLMAIMLVVIGWQYWRLAAVAVPDKQWAIWVCMRQLAIAMVSGIAVGIIGSFILVITGVNVAATGLVWLWLAALLLMLASPRYLCFAYAGGLIGLINLLTGFPLIDVSQLMVLIATLHLLEALLIYAVGHHAALPTIVKERSGRYLGGFTLQQFWPLPLVAAISGNPASVIPVFPAWWPLFAPGDSLLQLIGVLAVLGYAEITTTEYPAQRTHRSALNLLVYSLILLVLAIISFSLPGVQWLAVIFAPLGHELVIYLGLQHEEQGQPLWTSPEQGVALLWVVPGSPAQRANLQSGDIITSVNGQAVNGGEELNRLLTTSSRATSLVVVRAGQEYVLLLRKRPQQPAGLLVVPETSAADTSMGCSRTWFHNPRPAHLK